MCLDFVSVRLQSVLFEIFACVVSSLVALGHKTKDLSWPFQPQNQAGTCTWGWQRCRGTRPSRTRRKNPKSKVRLWSDDGTTDSNNNDINHNKKDISGAPSSVSPRRWQEKRTTVDKGWGGGDILSTVSIHSYNVYVLSITLHLTLSLPYLPRRHSENTSKSTEFDFYFAPFVWARERTSIHKHSIESRFVTGPSKFYIQFGGVYLCTFQLGHFTGWGSEGVNNSKHIHVLPDWHTINNQWGTSVCGSFVDTSYQPALITSYDQPFTNQ